MADENKKPEESVPWFSNPRNNPNPINKMTKEDWIRCTEKGREIEATQDAAIRQLIDGKPKEQKDKKPCVDPLDDLTQERVEEAMRKEQADAEPQSESVRRMIEGTPKDAKPAPAKPATEKT